MPRKVWNGLLIHSQTSTVQRSTVEVWEWICNFTPHIIKDYLSMPGLKSIHLSKRAPGILMISLVIVMKLCIVMSWHPHESQMPKSNRPISQIPECTCSISHNASCRTEMCILGFVKLVCSTLAFVYSIEYTHARSFDRIFVVEEMSVNISVAIVSFRRQYVLEVLCES